MKTPQKLLSLAVPCYNSAAYMRRCIDSLLACSSHSSIEIILIDDGSTDETPVIAQQYAANYPGIIQVIHQENRGHGGAVNTGLQAATGLYFKVVDSDDWLNPAAYTSLLSQLSQLAGQSNQPDLIVCNYVYEKEGSAGKKRVRYGNALPAGQVVSWQDTHAFRQGQYLLMHASLFKTSILRQAKLQLPQHTFYVDNLFVFIPLQKVTSLLYLDLDLYRYHIGREGQSVQENIMIQRINQQLFVNQTMVDSIRLENIPYTAQRNYLLHYLEIVTAVSSVLLVIAGTEQALAKRQQLWQYIQTQNPPVYNRLNNSFLGRIVQLQSKAGRQCIQWGYRLAKKIYKFN